MTFMTRTRPLLLTVTSCLFLAACGNGDANVAQKLGLDKEAPDEFSVVTRAPLSVPPDFELRPPRPGADSPMEMPMRQQARQTVFGVDSTSKKSAADRSTAQDEFLSKLGANAADTTIRGTVDKEVKADTEDKRPVAERLLYWNNSKKPEGKTIDPVEEKKRLEKEGVKPATSSATSTGTQKTDDVKPK